MSMPALTVPARARADDRAVQGGRQRLGAVQHAGPPDRARRGQAGHGLGRHLPQGAHGGLQDALLSARPLAAARARAPGRRAREGKGEAGGGGAAGGGVKRGLQCCGVAGGQPCNVKRARQARKSYGAGQLYDKHPIRAGLSFQPQGLAPVAHAAALKQETAKFARWEHGAGGVRRGCARGLTGEGRGRDV